MSFYFLRRDKFNEWLSTLSESFSLFVPRDTGKERAKTIFSSCNGGPDFTIFSWIRSANPLKEFFFLAREKVATYFGKEEEKEEKVRLLIGAKSCDILPLRVHRNMFLLKNFSDPFFQEKLAKTIILTADCPVPEKTCFCNLVNLTPHGSKEVDGNISIIIDEGIILETFTEKGEGLVKYGSFEPAPKSYLEKREELRRKAEEILLGINPNPLPSDLPKRIEKKEKRDFWEEKKKRCVECFGCLFVCPTCFCFLLYDFPKAERYERLRVWDTCYMASYARVGGGLNARPLFFQRFRNRFHCKFMNTYYDFNFFSCSGCGRCYEVCPAKIDIREILLSV